MMKIEEKIMSLKLQSIYQNKGQMMNLLNLIWVLNLKKTFQILDEFMNFSSKSFQLIWSNTTFNHDCFFEKAFSIEKEVITLNHSKKSSL